MTSLADELMNDFDSDSGGEDEELDAVLAGPSTSTIKEEDEDALMLGEVEDEDVKPTEGMLLPSGGVKPAEELDAEMVNEMEFKTVEKVSKVAKLVGGRQLKEVLQKIDYYKKNPDPELASNSESAEYQLIVQANNLNVEIDNEMLIVHKFIRDHYIVRFPELDSLVSAPLPYCRVILALGNGEDLRGDIGDILSSGAKMAVHVTAATSRGQVLDEKEWIVVTSACEVMFALDEAKKKILEYVESRISLLAPNISAIVGTTIATKILGIAGGLSGLVRIPSSNIYVSALSLVARHSNVKLTRHVGAQQVLGAAKKATTGFSTASHSVDRLHTGFIYQCPLVQETRPEDRMKAQRKVGAKVALAARIDSQGERKDGSFGEEMVDKLERELERLARPSERKAIKALPRPDEQKKSRRGGRRARKAKEAYAPTEMRQLQNRIKFGEAEEETGAYDETVGLGMIGTSSGKIRATAADSRSKAKLSKANKGRLASIKTSSSGTATSGLASSLAFTPVQGLELIDPSRARANLQKVNESWFAQEGTFTHVKKGGGIGKPAASSSNGAAK